MMRKLLTVFVSFGFVLIANAQVPKNIIFIIGDGMGLNQVYAMMTVLGGHSNLDRCTYTGFSKTYSYNNYITDSAAGGTALATGRKTKNGMVGLAPDSSAIKSILDLSSENADKSTGLVVACSVTHATPASFVAHQDSRKKDEAIALDYLSSPIDVFIGGGLKFFNQRSDNRDLTVDLKNKGFQLATSLEDVLRVKSGKLAGLIAEEHPEPASKLKNDYLPNATLKAIDLLSQDKDGFFLMIEASQIDWACHANQSSYLLSEMDNFNNTVGCVLDWAEKNQNTLVVITADHETGGLVIMDGDIKKETVDLNFTKKNHTGVMVPVYTYGPSAEKFSGIQENTDIANKIISLWNIAPKETLRK